MPLVVIPTSSQPSAPAAFKQIELIALGTIQVQINLAILPFRHGSGLQEAPPA